MAVLPVLVGETKQWSDLLAKVVKLCEPVEKCEPKPQPKQVEKCVDKRENEV